MNDIKIISLIFNTLLLKIENIEKDMTGFKFDPSISFSFLLELIDLKIDPDYAEFFIGIDKTNVRDFHDMAIAIDVYYFVEDLFNMMKIEKEIEIDFIAFESDEISCLMNETIRSIKIKVR